MSDDTKQHNDLTSDDDGGDTAIRNLYHKASNEEPSAQLDATIIAQARQAAGRQTPSQVRTHKWYVPFSVAATLVISTSLVVLMMSKEPEMDVGTVEISQLDRQKAFSPAIPSRRESVASLSEDIVPLKKEDSISSLGKQLSEPTVADSVSEFAASNVFEEEAKSPAIKGSVNELASITSLSEKRQLKSETEGSINTVEGELSDFRMSAAPKTSMAKLNQDSVETKVIESDVSCNEFNQNKCLNSLHCTLELDKENDNYLCRSSNNHCEQNYLQYSGSGKECKVKRNCEFLPSKCYCPPGKICECEGGNPAQCRLIEK